MSSDATAFCDAELAALRAMTPEAKIEVAESLRRTALALTEAGVRMREPGLSGEEVRQRVLQLFARADA